MTQLKDTELLLGEGRFREALQSLSKVAIRVEERARVDVLRAHLLERTGNYGQSRVLCDQVLRAKRTKDADKSACETTLGIIKQDTGDSEGGIAHFQRAISLAKGAQDLQQTCWSQLRLLLGLTNRSGPASTVALLGETRANVVRLGDPQVSAALQIFVGEIEAKRGLIQSAEQHTKLGLQLLGDEPNLWLEARAEITLVAVAIMRSEIDEGIIHARLALELSRKSGTAGLIRASLANLGNLHFLAGQFDEAVKHLKDAFAALPDPGELSGGALESLARVSLARDDLVEAATYLDRVDAAIGTNSEMLLYVNRHTHLTRSELLARQDRIPDAVDAADRVADLAFRTGDQLLLTRALLQKSLFLQRLGRMSESAHLLVELKDQKDSAPETHAQYERTIACALATAGDVPSGRLHFDRAKRIYRGLQNVPGLIDLDRAWNAATERPTAAPVPPGPSPRLGANLLQNVAMLMMHAGRPDLIATGLVSILADSGCVTTAAAISRASDATIETLASFDASPATDRSTAPPQKTFAIGSARNRTIEVTVQPLADLESVATLNAVSVLLATARDLEQAHAEREERQTLWPIDDIPAEGEQAVVAGKMREVMTFARKVAATTASVLISGESGTGKEILASAIHRYSARATRPFVPFNCTAIPRELLESQLFGHRRGAFTGAERDHPGLIRAAQGGTLFLDEIGELGLDLQPKLLRFLESGEICPLGEPSPFNVDVRIIAATNANLEELVRQGRFREDLFYRLNVIRLAIPPLRERRDEVPGLAHHFAARASAEFSKGRVRISQDTMEHLLLYPWPGNVRQLFNEIRRMVALADVDAVLKPSALSLQILRATPKPHATGGPELAIPLQDKLTPTLTRLEREMVRAALHRHNGQLEEAARSLGISRKGLYLKRQRFGL